MIEDSTVANEDDSKFYVKNNHFKGLEGLCELLTRKKRNVDIVTSEDYRKYKTILKRTNACFEQYDPGGNNHF